MKAFPFWLITLICSAHSIFLFAQENTSYGIVVDSASQQPLPYVAVQIKGKASGISSSDDGSFSIHCNVGDTLVFTRLGYNPGICVIKFRDSFLKIELSENARMLKDITVYDKITLPGIDDWKKDLKPSKPIKLQNGAQVASQGMLPTFGPGITIGFGGKDKTKDKRDELLKTEVYRTTINSPEVKKKLMDLYSIPEETYYRKLEAFNKENPDASHLKSRDEIISMLIQFFAMKER